MNIGKWEPSKHDKDQVLKRLITELIHEYEVEELYLFGELRDPRGVLDRLIAHCKAKK